MLSRTMQAFGSGLRTKCEALGVPLRGDGEGAVTSHLLFLDLPVDINNSDYFERSEYRYSNMRNRTFIDIGFGTPENFIDLVIKPDGELETDA